MRVSWARTGFRRLAGLVESAKHAIIADSDYFDFLENNLDAVLARKPEVLARVAFFNCKIKGKVVQADPFEQNMRRILNYGHTLGHAVEAASGFELLHGESVAIGIIAAGLIEIELGLAKPGRLERIQRIFTRIGVPPTSPRDLTNENLVELMKHDKKAVDKWPRFVLLSEIGRAHCQNGRWAVQVDRRLVEKVLDKLRQK